MTPATLDPVIADALDAVERRHQALVDLGVSGPGAYFQGLGIQFEPLKLELVGRLNSLIDHMAQATLGVVDLDEHTKDALRACFLGAWLRGFAVAVEYTERREQP